MRITLMASGFVLLIVGLGLVKHKSSERDRMVQSIVGTAVDVPGGIRYEVSPELKAHKPIFVKKQGTGDRLKDLYNSVTFPTYDKEYTATVRNGLIVAALGFLLFAGAGIYHFIEWRKQS